tara:strand:+ start:653 stop:1018 length:366 start_codon:yes stop_codon:yes gene_type:complete
VYQYYNAICISGCDSREPIYDIGRHLTQPTLGFWWVIVIVGFILFLVAMFDNNRDVITIPNPFDSVIEAYKLKKQYVRELNEVYVNMAATDLTDTATLTKLNERKERIEVIVFPTGNKKIQ